MSMLTINEIGRRWNTQYQAMGKSPALAGLHSIYVEMMLHALKVEADLIEARRELAAIKDGKTFTPAPSTTSETPPRQDADAIIAALKEKYPGMIRGESAALKREQTITSTPSAPAASTTTPQPDANFWTTAEGQVKLRQNWPIVKPGSTASSARRPAPTAESLDYNTPEGLDALKKKWGID